MDGVHYIRLVKGKQYYINAYFKDKKEKKYLGEFFHNIYFETGHYSVFTNVKSINENLSACYMTFCPRDRYYDVEKVRKNARRAMQTMEQRALNMILKRLVNDDFQWS